MRFYSPYSARRPAGHGTPRPTAIIKAALTLLFATSILGGFSSQSECQTALSFVTSKGVQVYDLTYVNSSDCVPHLFAGTPTDLPQGPLGVVVFSVTVNDPTLVGRSFQDVFNADEADIIDWLPTQHIASDVSQSNFLAEECSSYTFTVNVPGNPGSEVTGNGVLFSNGQDIGTIIFDPPPITFAVYGLASETALVPEPGSLSAAIAGGIPCAAFALRRRRSRRVR